MRSRADQRIARAPSVRLWVERLLRVVALGALVLAMWQLVQPASTGRSVSRVAPLRVMNADSALSAVRAVILRESAAVDDNTAAGAGAIDTLSLRLVSLPAANVRAGLASVRAAGRPLHWIDSTGASGLALSVTRLPTPNAPIELRAVTASPEALVLRDAGGRLDSIPRPVGGVAWRLMSATAPLIAQQGRGVATASVPAGVRARRVLVVGQPGWESKFVVAALEEAGWSVDGSLRVSPTGLVTVGAPQSLDTARYAAVVVLDSMDVNASAYARFVRNGGGLVLGGDALRIPALAPLLPARATARRGAIAGALLTETPRLGLEAWEVTPRPDAVVLQVDRGDHGHDEPALVAKRVGSGRVVAMPYRETWRWRMQGTDDGRAEHGTWWQAALAAAVPAPLSSGRRTADPFPGDAAPWADLVALAGPPMPLDSLFTGVAPVTAQTTGEPEVPLHRRLPVLFTVALTALLAEWASRRLRGLR